jgi:MFS family permease
LTEEFTLAGSIVRASTVYRYRGLELGRGDKEHTSIVPKKNYPIIRDSVQNSCGMPTKSVTLPSSPATIIEVAENDEPPPKENATEYSSLLPRRNSKCNRRPIIKKYNALEKSCDHHHKFKSNCTTYCRNDSTGEESNSDDTATSDEISSNSTNSSTNSTFTNSLTARQLRIFCIVMMTTCVSSLTVCLFPPFFPAVAESKGVSATGYGLIIGTNCLVAFLVTPFIGNNLNNIGVKFAYICGLILGGVCCILSGLLEFIQPGPTFMAVAVSIRIVHAIGNAFVITSSFTYNACEFPNSMGKIFSLTRTAMNVAQMGGPWLGGVLLEVDGFYLPFLVMGSLQICIAIVSSFTLPHPDQVNEREHLMHNRKKKGKASVCKILSIPSVWLSFIAFIVATMCNGFLSVNLEPQVIRNFGLSASNVGLLYGLRDGANSLASPVWGWLCDKKRSVKPYLVISSLLVAVSFFLMKAYEQLGIYIDLNIYVLVLALCINGMGVGGQQIAGVIDALHETMGAGFPDDPSTQGLVAGLWSSLSGMGRFISRAGSGYLVDQFGFSFVSAIFCVLQLSCTVVTFLYLIMCECHLQKREYARWDDVTVVDGNGRDRDDKVVFTESYSPSESLMTRSIYIGLPHSYSAGMRIANSMPPKMLLDSNPRNRSRSIR